MVSSGSVVVFLLVCLSSVTVESAPPAPRNVKGTFHIGRHSGPILLWLTWDSQVQDAGTDLWYRVYYREDSVSIFTEDVVNGSNNALLPVGLGRTYEVWVTSILDGEESQPSDTLTLNANYLQYVTATPILSGVAFRCTFAKVAFDVGCKIRLSSSYGLNVTRVFNAIDHNTTSVPVAEGIIEGLDASNEYDYSVHTVRLHDGMVLQPNVQLTGRVRPLDANIDVSLITIILLTIGVVLLPPLLLVCVVVCHCKSKKQSKEKYGNYITTIEELNTVFKPGSDQPSQVETAPVDVKPDDNSEEGRDEWVPLTDLPASRSGTLRSSLSGTHHHSRQFSGSDFLKALSLSDIEATSSPKTPGSVKKARRLSFKTSFPFVNFYVPTDQTDGGWTMSKAYSCDTGLDAELHHPGNSSADNVSLRTSLYNIIDQFDSRWNSVNFQISDTSDHDDM